MYLNSVRPYPLDTAVGYSPNRIEKVSVNIGLIVNALNTADKVKDE